MKLQDKKSLKNPTPDMALKKLMEGNERFVNNLNVNRNLLEQVYETAKGQNPFAVVLSCIDSRISAELIFDQGIGDIFSVRIAGNIVNEDIIGSMEFACGFAGAKLIFVLGHTNCGAIRGACDNIEAGSLTKLLEKIKPAIENIKKETGTNMKFELVNEKIARENVRLTIQEIVNQSSILKNMIDNQEIRLVGGIYNVKNGNVSVIDKD